MPRQVFELGYMLKIVWKCSGNFGKLWGNTAYWMRTHGGLKVWGTTVYLNALRWPRSQYELASLCDQL